jgi:hypothetical protein
MPHKIKFKRWKARIPKHEQNLNVKMLKFGDMWEYS